MVILGIDPGTATTGYGVVETTPKLTWAAHGTIDTPKNKPAKDRLLLLEQGLRQLFKKYRPDLLCVERLYFFKNAKTALPVSEAKGVVLLVAAHTNVSLREFTPLQAKMAVTGYGKAQKIQVQRMVQQILGLTALPRPDDAADALALAIAGSVLTRSGK
ncbi:MAG: crossover junction endodeoxyribonuclease RuvC [Candidatus Wildermuthbacteria bacterium RIFCSPHIGHO2_01_FULL_49_22b]|uniref:Crossover junction endodeoxyribonuclease RuvC n=1 Tax=Candidatus Wildermuthbacteria bacterium RIFCSPHIGHO2_01_FULL_49_22b TaxID=1802448 RepID=A0A1G2QXC6_9BACT|nr:MAG: crossover junction endodeoxyribonuclease RuvC [Candidatus Wildermuthbacteria bacterium RIFCSPHIGHO2_01_FULL_49_22b]